ncbi:hypothetical protein C7T35_36765 [Variovorax sp. WS11]|uniref:hypothetical protein n=1 Tax=Variovorax sp. WS11 TaxID=1105204 RepID=UPI000D0DD5E9|nr:hypothetical protein [Variovorax sp. WS11]NDZ17657.1 hypothetical protein [Variovorax sp. WS11]PSL79563.1 hypothetical protein C7T35_36765 [Variovorax sp. WS11]
MSRESSRFTFGDCVGAQSAERQAVLKVALLGIAVRAEELRDAIRRHAGGTAGEIVGWADPADDAADDSSHGVLGLILRSQPDVVLECADARAVRRYAPALVKTGIPLVITSVGALIGRDAACVHAAPGKVSFLPHNMQAYAELFSFRTKVSGTLTYQARKSLEQWLGETSWAEWRGLEALDEPVCFYRGPADNAAQLFPLHAAEWASAALAVGMSALSTELWIDSSGLGDGAVFAGHKQLTAPPGLSAGAEESDRWAAGLIDPARRVPLHLAVEAIDQMPLGGCPSFLAADLSPLETNSSNDVPKAL